MKHYQKIILALFLTGYIFSCSEDSFEETIANDSVTSDVVDTTNDNVFDATDWTTETHSKDAEPNFDVVFEDNTV